MRAFYGPYSAAEASSSPSSFFFAPFDFAAPRCTYANRLVRSQVTRSSIDDALNQSRAENMQTFWLNEKRKRLKKKKAVPLHRETLTCCSNHWLENPAHFFSFLVTCCCTNRLFRCGVNNGLQGPGCFKSLFSFLLASLLLLLLLLHIPIYVCVCLSDWQQ